MARPNGDGYIDRAEYDSFAPAQPLPDRYNGYPAGWQRDLTSKNVVGVNKSYPNIPAPLVYRDVMYLMKESGIVSSVNPATGEVLKMGRTPEALEEYYASPVAADGKIFMVSVSCKVTVLKAGAHWEVLATNDLDEECWATPAIAGNSLIIRTRSSVYSFVDGLK